MDLSSFSFARPKLADQYCEALLGESLKDARSGLFLAAPRRTGKSFFLRSDMLPAFKARGWETVYVDLWTDQSAGPGRLIAKAVKGVLQQYKGIIASLAKASGLEKVTIFGALTVNINALDLPDNISLADALEALAIASKKPVVIVIDEAQHAISTQQGIDAMFALKAAREQLNQGSDKKQKLFLVFTGSNRDKLSELVRSNKQPFYGCDITKFPLLGRSFSDAFATLINKKLAADNQFTIDAVWEAFQLVGQRPEMLRELLGDLALDEGAASLQKALSTGAEKLRKTIWQEKENEFNALKPTQKAVLVHIIQEGDQYDPFTTASLASYTATVGKPVNASDAQAALNALRKAGIVWKAVKGDYALEDETMALWYSTQVAPGLVTVGSPSLAPATPVPTSKPAAGFKVIAKKSLKGSKKSGPSK